MKEDIDAALIALFEWDPGAEERLAGFGPDAFGRVLELYRGRAGLPARLRELIAELGRESLDCWSHAIAVVAWANPTIYVDQLDEQPAWLDVSIMRDIDDPRVVGILRRALERDDWLIRYHAIRSLAKRPEPEAWELLRMGLTDPVELIREEARQALREQP